MRLLRPFLFGAIGSVVLFGGAGLFASLMTTWMGAPVPPALPLDPMTALILAFCVLALLSGLFCATLSWLDVSERR